MIISGTLKTEPFALRHSSSHRNPLQFRNLKFANSKLICSFLIFFGTIQLTGRGEASAEAIMVFPQVMGRMLHPWPESRPTRRSKPRRGESHPTASPFPRQPRSRLPRSHANRPARPTLIESETHCFKMAFFSLKQSAVKALGIRPAPRHGAERR
jgi:hypothetical protein